MPQFCNVEFAKMTDIIKHRGIVENIEGSHVRVRIVQTSACSACSVKGHCNASESKEKLIDVFDMKASSYRIGEEVMIYGTTSMGMQAVLLAFGIPFLVLLITLFISMRFTGGDELRSALVALSALLPYYLIIYVCRNKLSKKFSFTLEPIKNNSPINEFIFRIQKNTYLFNKYGIPFEKEWINDNSKGIDDFLKYINS